MLGHGRPSEIVRFLQTVAMCALYGVAVCCFAVNTSGAAELSLRLRAEWTSAAPERPEIAISTDTGSIEHLRNLSLEPGSTGGLDLSPDTKQLTLRSRSASLRGGVEFTISGKPDSKITINCPNEKGASSDQKPANYKLSDLVSEPKLTNLIGGRVQLLIDRSPGDRLRIGFDRESLIFRPGEATAVSITPNATGIEPNQKLRLTMTLTAARQSKPIHQQHWQVETDADGEIAPIDVGLLKIPEAESAYNLNVRLEPERRYLALEVPWPATDAAIQRTAQFVVIADSPPEHDTRPFVEVAWIEPTKRQWWNPTWIPERLSPGKLVSDTMPAIVSSRHQPISSEPLTVVEWQQTKIAELKPLGWQAYPLQVKDVGKPHLLTVRYPNDRPMRMGISLLEPNANGQVIPLGIDSGVSVLSQPIAARAQLLEHQIVFWPRTRQPMILLTNFDSSTSAWFASVQLQAGPNTLPVSDAARNLDSPSQHEQRLAALYLDKPVLADTFGCSKWLDAPSGQLIEDWETFLQAGRRLVEYVKWSGFNGAIITVNSEGAALYPTETMSPTPRYDMATFSSQGLDPYKKDVLELLMRMFDRSGLKLIPAVELATPLTSLERELRNPQTAVGIEPVNSAGHRFVDVSQSEHGLAPYYNPLDPRVQQAVTAVASELNQRYGHHRAFHGLGVHLGGNTFMQMPGFDWGVDAKTLEMFAGSVQNAPTARNQMIRWVEEQGRGEFMAWRGQQLATMYCAMAKAIGSRPLLMMFADWLSDTPNGNTDSKRCGGN